MVGVMGTLGAVARAFGPDISSYADQLKHGKFTRSAIREEPEGGCGSTVFCCDTNDPHRTWMWASSDMRLHVLKFWALNGLRGDCGLLPAEHQLVRLDPRERTSTCPVDDRL
jgi:hypothetical protein